MATIESASTVGIPSSIGNAARPRSGITVHYNGPALNRGAHANCRAQVRGMHNHHRNGNGWAGIGYHYLVCHHGVVLTGRGLNRVGAHAPGANATHIGVQFMLGGSQEPTADQLRGFRELWTWLVGQGVRDHITGHRDHGSTSCPGAPLYRRVQSGEWGSGSGSTGEDEMLGLSRGDKGDRVRLLQYMLRLAGYASQLGSYGPRNDGVDGDYGPATARALLQLRQDYGSTATSGDSVTYYAVGQIHAMVARNQGN